MHGPFMEIREELGGYLFEAGDLDAASGRAARIPARSQRRRGRAPAAGRALNS
jgi:hypothetical protein